MARRSPSHINYQFVLQDIVVLHPETAHAGGPNLSSKIRSMVYFRIKSTTLYRASKECADLSETEHPYHIKEYLADMWSDFKAAPFIKNTAGFADI